MRINRFPSNLLVVITIAMATAMAACSAGDVEGRAGNDATPASATADGEVDASVPPTSIADGVDSAPASTIADPVPTTSEDIDPTAVPEPLPEQIEAPAPNPEPVVELTPDPDQAVAYPEMLLSLHQCCDTSAALADIEGAVAEAVVVDNGVFFGAWTLHVPASPAVSNWSIALTLPDETYAFSTNNEQFSLRCLDGACAAAYGDQTPAIVTDRRYQAVIVDLDAAALPAGTYEVRLASQPGDIVEVAS